MVAHERRPLRVRRHRRPGGQRLDHRTGVPAGQRQVEPLHGDEVELHGELAAVGAAEELQLLLVRQVHLAEQDRGLGPPAHQRAQGPQVLVRVGEPRGLLRVHPRGVQQERDGVDAEAVDAELQPEAHDLGQLVADPRVR